MGMLKNSQDCLNRMTPPKASLTGLQIQAGITAGGGHTWAPVHATNPVLFCQGASLLSTGTAGVLAVHLTEDAPGTWYLLDLEPGEYVGAEFDLVGDSTEGTTVALDAKLYIYPCINSLSNS